MTEDPKVNKVSLDNRVRQDFKVNEDPKVSKVCQERAFQASKGHKGHPEKEDCTVHLERGETWAHRAHQGNRVIMECQVQWD